VLINSIVNLDYKVAFFTDESHHLKDIYPHKPLKIKALLIPKGKLRKTMFKFQAINPESFKLSYTFNNKESTKQYSYGKNISIKGFLFKIDYDSRKEIPSIVYFSFTEINDLYLKVHDALKIDENLNTNILNLTYTDANPNFACDILNSILTSYQKFDKIQRSSPIKQTSYYIDTLLSNLSVVLKKSALDIQHFKATNQMLNISSNSELLINRLTHLETEKHNLQIQNLYANELRNALEKSRGVNNPNFNLQGVLDLQLISLITKFNLLIDKKNEAIKLYQPGTIYMNNLEEQLNEVKNAINDNVRSQNSKNKSLLFYLNRQIGEIKAGMQSAPELEKDYISLQSEYNINQKVYNYLSEKKLEAQISTAAVTSGAQIIDHAVVSNSASYPIEASIYKDFALAGLLIGTVSIFVMRKLNPYLYDVETIENLTNIPIIGILRKHNGSFSEDKILSIDHPRSLFSESVRAMRANLHYMVNRDNGKIICVTSEVAGEGKSFTSLNLAGSLCLTDKKVVIVATDLRKSQLHKTFRISNFKGLSSYLSRQLSIDQVCHQTRFENLDFIPAGPVPPNPSELIQSPKMRELITYLQERYDFIILDSAPVGLVSDSIPLMRMADVNLFVLRYGFSRLHAANLPYKLSTEFGLANMTIVLNAFKNNPVQKNYYSLTSNERSYEHYDSPTGN
jgi:tyrosine-protein kinase Etk/Wzc